MNKTQIIILIILIVIAGLFGLGKALENKESAEISYFQDTEIACLKDGHVNLADHIHPELKIYIDGEQQKIPANVGIDQECMSEVHTHDGTGKIHVESFIPGRVSQMGLINLFDVWGTEVEKESYDLEIIQDGQVKNSIEEVNFIDKSIIELKYTSKNIE